MSGSPVFDPVTADVLAVHHAGREGTVAFAVPLSAAMISDMLSTHSAGQIGSAADATASMVTRPPKRVDDAEG
jgi:hypothetical protein